MPARDRARLVSKAPPSTPPRAPIKSSPRAKSPGLLPSPRPTSPNPPLSTASSSKKRPPKAWWEYEEQLARQAYELRAEAANAKTLHTRDLGILLQQQLVLRGRVDELHQAFELGETGGGGPNADRLASAVAETAKEATELQLHLLERGAASLRQEADAAKADADEARADAAAKASEIARLHTQLANATRRARRLEHEEPERPQTPVRPQSPRLARSCICVAEGRSYHHRKLRSRNSAPTRPSSGGCSR